MIHFEKSNKIQVLESIENMCVTNYKINIWPNHIYRTWLVIKLMRTFIKTSKWNNHSNQLYLVVSGLFYNDNNSHCLLLYSDMGHCIVISWYCLNIQRELICSQRLCMQEKYKSRLFSSNLKCSHMRENENNTYLYSEATFNSTTCDSFKRMVKGGPESRFT